MTVDEFIATWEGTVGGAEKKNFPVFINQLCALLGVDPPSEPAVGRQLGPYEYEGPVPKGSFRSIDASGAIDLYRRGHFIMEAKQSYLKPEQVGLDLGEDARPRAPSGARYDKLMRDARSQAENYAKNLPASEPVAPFLIVCDIGRAFEVYHDTAGNGRGYTFFPDKQRYRIELADLRRPEIIERLKAIWTDPKSIDPRFQSADVTRRVAGSLAQVSKDIEEGTRLRSKFPTARERAEEIEESALFLMRILFCMFAEDIGLLPDGKFKDFLKRAEANDKLLENGLADLWKKMGAANISPRFAHAVEAEVLYFNGGLFSETARTIPLTSINIHHLYEAARQNWRKVEPAIFGTLLEQALTAEERAKLGAHYTPRPYVETLVRATIMDVLEPKWEAVEESGEDGLLERAEAFHERLATIRVLDPACGTGNFLYVAMELMQALESRVIETIETLGAKAEPKVGPHQFHGLEKNPRAAKIAELVLWIGWLRNRLHDDPDSVPQPVLAESASINFGLQGGYDAVLKMNAMGEPDLENPMIPDWPEAEFIVGNPPFIGKGALMRSHLGDAYVDALQRANPRVGASADFVMQWWDRAAHSLIAKKSPLIRFGLVTTNSITQEFNRRVIDQYIGDGRVSIVMAVPDHPWTKATDDAAAVRIAMTVTGPGQVDGELIEVVHAEGLDTDTPTLKLVTSTGRINLDLTVGADVTSARPLKANDGISNTGMMLAGQGFKISAAQASELRREDGPEVTEVIRPYVGGGELMDRPLGRFVVDFYGYTEAEARTKFPATYEHVLRFVKPERDLNRQTSRRENWWLFGRSNAQLRAAKSGLSRFVATVETAKHRVFQFVDGPTIPDHMAITISTADAFHLGVLQSFAHVMWALRAGGTLEDRPRYNKAACFEPFPFPDSTSEQRAILTELAEELDATRKAALAETDKLTMTELYNLRARLKSGDPMDDEDQRRATKARAAIVDRLHEQIDLAVADAYGWGEEWKAGALGPSEIVARLVALNHQRAAEEAQGQIRWLRPDYQIPRFS